jgi:hypothetical protein
MSGARAEEALLRAAAGDDRDKIAVAVERYAWRRAETRDEFAFGYDALFREFEKTADILPRPMLERWFAAGSLSKPDDAIQCEYTMVLAHERTTGRFAGVRDCFVTVDRRTRRAVVLLAHTLVLPEFRRSGVAAILRSVPVVLVHDADEILLAGEMDMAVPEPKGTVVRLLAYARAGFRVIPPTMLPYAQPDLRDLSGGLEPEPLPFLCLVRQVGEEDRRDISRARARAFVDHIDAVHRCHMDGAQLDAIRDHAFTALARVGLDPLPLLDLPRDATELAMLRPFLKSVAFRLYPESWRGSEPLADPDDEMRAVLEAWAPRDGVTSRPS